MFNWTADILMILAVSVLGSALVPVRHLIMQVPYGVLRKRWRAMSVLISLFIAGYLGYTIKFWHENNSWHDLIVPMVFFFGAVFVWLSTYNAQQTVMDMRRAPCVRIVVALAD